MKLRVILAAGAAALLLTVPSRAATPSLCDAVAGNIVRNCGFESTTFQHNGATVPLGWTENGAYDANPEFNLVVDGSANSGAANLSIGNFDNQPVPSVTQNLTTVAGDTYAGTIYVDYLGCCADPGAFFDVAIDNSPVLTLGASNTTASWLPYAFSFTATGADTLAIQANTSPEEWYVDDVTVADTAPEPAASILLGSGLLAVWSRRFRPRFRR